MTESEYTETCSRLLKQYKSNLTDETVSREFVDLETFKRTWEVSLSLPRLSPISSAQAAMGIRARPPAPAPTCPSHARPFQCQSAKQSAYPPSPFQIDCPRATERLRTGLPATISLPAPTPSTHGPAPSHAPSGALISTATENFITFLDALKLHMYSKDSLHPLLSEVIQSVNKVTDRDFEDRGKIIQWLIALNQMRATEELSEEQARELSFDMEGAYHGFKATLS